MVKNYFNCAKPIWKQFSVKQKEMFNYVYEKSIHNQDLIIHPRTLPIMEEEWTTIVYNMACFAAWGLKNLNINIDADEDIETGKCQEKIDEPEPEFFIDVHHKEKSTKKEKGVE